MKFSIDSLTRSRCLIILFDFVQFHLGNLNLCIYVSYACFLEDQTMSFTKFKSKYSVTLNKTL